MRAVACVPVIPFICTAVARADVFVYIVARQSADSNVQATAADFSRRFLGESCFLVHDNAAN